jgi:hypothetical protein
MKTRPIAVAVLLAFTPATLTVVTPAVAQADDPTTKAARARFQEGVDFYDKGQFENARASFLQAYALRKHPAVLLNLAQSCLKSGHTLEAARYFQQYLREAPTMTAGQRNDAERGLNDARAKLGRIAVDAPSGVEIFVDDERIGTTPLRDPVDVEPGSHTVKARGRTDETVTVTASTGREVTAHFGSSSSAAALPPPSPPPASSPPAPPPPPPEKEPEKPAEPAPEAPPPPHAAEEASSGSGGTLLSPPVIIGGLVAIAGFGTAIAMSIAKSSAQSAADSVADQIRSAATAVGEQPTGICASTRQYDVNRYGKACAALSDDNSKVNTDATIANIGLGVGIAASLFTLGYLAFAGKSSPHTSGTWKAPVITPMVGAGTGGMNVVGTF